MVYRRPTVTHGTTKKEGEKEKKKEEDKYNQPRVSLSLSLLSTSAPVASQPRDLHRKHIAKLAKEFASG